MSASVPPSRRRFEVPCIDCGYPDTRIVESRHVERRRECPACKARFITEEIFKRKARKYTRRH